MPQVNQKQSKPKMKERKNKLPSCFQFILCAKYTTEFLRLHIIYLDCLCAVYCYAVAARTKDDSFISCALAIFCSAQTTHFARIILFSSIFLCVLFFFFSVALHPLLSARFVPFHWIKKHFDLCLFISVVHKFKCIYSSVHCMDLCACDHRILTATQHIQQFQCVMTLLLSETNPSGT